MNENLGKTIRYFRLLHGMTVKQLARELNTKPCQLHKVERGEAGLTMCKFWKMMGVLKIGFQIYPLRPGSAGCYKEMIEPILNQRNARTSKLFKACHAYGIAITIQPLPNSIKFEHVLTYND